MRMKMLILILFLAVVAMGCSRKSEEYKLSETTNQIQGMADYKPSGDISRAFMENITYEVEGITWEGDLGVAKVKVSTPDLEQIILDSIQEAIDDCGVSDYDKLLNIAKNNAQNHLNSADYSSVESVVVMDAERSERGYTLISNEEFEDAISGNIDDFIIRFLTEEIGNEKST